MRPAAEADFARDGFRVVRQAVPAPLVAALRETVERVQASVASLPPHLLERLTLERDLPAGRRGGRPASEVGDAIFLLGDPVAFDPVFLQLPGQPRIIDALRAALGVRDIAAHFMNVTIKHPRFGRGIGWHRDFPNLYASPAASGFARVMLCLDGMSAESGATAFVPGSHRLTDEEARAAPAGETPPAGAVVLACCDPGDAVLIHPKVLHGGGMNSSARPRRNIVLQAGDAALPLVEIPAQETLAGLRLGAG